MSDGLRRLYTADNPLSMLATPLGHDLSSLCALEISQGTPSGHRDSFERGFLPGLPIHPQLLHLCTPLASISNLNIHRITFANLSDLTLLLSCCLGIKDLRMGILDILGNELEYMWMAGAVHTRRTTKFLPKLVHFKVCIFLS